MDNVKNDDLKHKLYKIASAFAALVDEADTNAVNKSKQIDTSQFFNAEVYKSSK